MGQDEVVFCVFAHSSLFPQGMHLYETTAHASPRMSLHLWAMRRRAIDSAIGWIGYASHRFHKTDLAAEGELCNKSTGILSTVQKSLLRKREQNRHH